MSDPRNTLRRFLNNPRVVSFAALGCATSTLLVACSADTVTAPGGPVPSAHFAAGKSEAEKAAEDSLKAVEKAVKDSIKAEERAGRNLAKAQLDSLKDDWDAYKKAVKKTGLKGSVLRCEPQKRESDTEIIGPKGGTLSMGPHRLVIPEGALDHDVVITGTAPSNPAVNLEFAPHGLQFKKPVEMVIDYKQCIVPDDQELGVTYMGPGWRAIEQMPSSDKRSVSRISALTDHFSGFVVTWSRTRSY